MSDKVSLPLLLLVTGVFVTFMHEFTYRRTGGDDFELGGLVSHAGADMLVLTVGMLIAGVVWQMRVRK